MPLFTSHRERTLWLLVLAVMVAIYSTLGPARVVAAYLRTHDLLEPSIIGVLLLILVGVILLWIRQRPGWREIGVGLGVVFAFLMIGVRINSWEERTHLIEYGVVAALIHQALLERSKNGQIVWKPAALTVILTALLGTLDEVIQAFIPSRVFDPRDIFFNVLAGFMVVAGRLAIPPQKQPGWRIWFLWLMAASYGWGWGVYWGWFDGTEPKTLQSIPENIWAGYLGLITGGLLMGFLQTLVLRKHIQKPYLWLASYVAAIGIAGLIMWSADLYMPDYGWLVGISVFGTVAGVMQWLLIREQLPNAGWWVLACTVAWIVGMPAGDAAGPPALGALFGAITGAVLVRLLRQTPTKSQADD